MPAPLLPYLLLLSPPAPPSLSAPSSVRPVPSLFTPRATLRLSLVTLYRLSLSPLSTIVRFGIGSPFTCPPPLPPPAVYVPPSFPRPPSLPRPPPFYFFKDVRPPLVHLCVDCAAARTPPLFRPPPPPAAPVPDGRHVRAPRHALWGGRPRHALEFPAAANCGLPCRAVVSIGIGAGGGGGRGRLVPGAIAALPCCSGVGCGRGCRRRPPSFDGRDQVRRGCRHRGDAPQRFAASLGCAPGGSLARRYLAVRVAPRIAHGGRRGRGGGSPPWRPTWWQA